MAKIKKGDYVYTPRFCSVEIKKVFRSRNTAGKQGFVEPTHYTSSEYDILGKHTGTNMMIFAAVKKL
jgi:hypothetical protein